MPLNSLLSSLQTTRFYALRMKIVVNIYLVWATRKRKNDKKEDTENEFKRKEENHIYIKTTIYRTLNAFPSHQ